MRFRTSVVVGLAALIAVGCGGPAGRGQPDAVGQPAGGFPQLTVPSLDELAAKQSDHIFANRYPGSWFFTTQGSESNVEAVDDTARFNPGASEHGYAYAEYLYAAEEHWKSLWIETDWETPPALPPHSNCWLGLMVFPEETIRWFALEPGGVVFLADAEPYTLHADYERFDVLVFVVVTGTESCVLRQISVANSPTDTFWDLEVVDSGFPGLFTASMVLDADGEPRIFYEAVDRGGCFAQRDHGEWSIETVHDVRTSSHHSSLARDSAGNPHIAYQLNPLDEGDPGIHYATKQNGVWDQELVVPGPGILLNNMVVDGDDNPHLVYHVYDDASLHYAYREGDGWKFERILGPCGEDSSLFVTPDGVPSIAYQHSEMLWYAYYKNKTWWFVNVDDQLVSGQEPALLLDSRNGIHIIYKVSLGEGYRHLWYAHWDGETSKFTDFSEETNSLWGVGGQVLRIDSSNLPQIAYVASKPHLLGELKLARFDGEVWHIEFVGYDFRIPPGSYFALDSQDRPHFCLTDIDSDTVLYYLRPH